MYWHSQGRSRSRRMPKSISVYTTVLLHSSDGLRDERKRNALTLSSIANLHPCINGGRHGGYGRGWRPTIASSKANFCSVAGVLSRPAVLFLYVPHPPPGILDPLPSLSLQKISDSLNHFHAIWARNALPYRQIPVQANLWFMQCLQIKFQPKTCSLRSGNAASKIRFTT